MDFFFRGLASTLSIRSASWALAMYVLVTPSFNIIAGGVEVSLVSHDDGKKNCEMTKGQNCTLQFDKKTASVELCQHAVLD